MKRLCFAIVILFTTIACKESTPKETESPKKTTEANYQSVEMGIDGMTCEVGCARTIESKISKMEGVVYSKVDFENKKGVFTYDLNITNSEDIKEKIAGIAGGDLYFPRDLKIYEKIVK